MKDSRVSSEIRNAEPRYLSFTGEDKELFACLQPRLCNEQFRWNIENSSSLEKVKSSIHGCILCTFGLMDLPLILLLKLCRDEI